VLWLPRYFRYSIEVKQVESTGTGGDRSFHGMFTCVLMVLLCFKESKEKKTKNEKRKYSENKDRNIEGKAFVIFDIISKTK